MKAFASAREAKEFLVSRISSEAELEGIPLSETERRELYFSETASTLPEIPRINEEFERSYDQEEHERKMATLIRNARRRDAQTNSENEKLWSEAIGMLQGEDHYILVTIRQAGISTRPRGDFLKLLVSAFVVIGLIMCLVFVSEALHIDSSRQARAFYMWVTVASAASFYYLLLMVLGRKRVNDLLAGIVERLVIRFVRTR